MFWEIMPTSITGIILDFTALYMNINLYFHLCVMVNKTLPPQTLLVFSVRLALFVTFHLPLFSK